MAFDPNNLRMNLVENFDDLVEFMAWIRAGHRFIGVDIETDGLDWYDGKIRLVQFGTMTEGYAVPYERFTGAIYEALRSLRDAGTLIIGHNIGGFDLTWLRRHGGFEPNWANVHDSMILAALLDTAGSKALKTLSTVYVSPVAAYGQTALKDDMARYGLTWETVPIELPSYWVYGIMDTILTVHLFFELYRRCESLGLINAYNTERHVEKILHQVSWNGMLVDQDHLHHQRDFWRSRCAELQVICNDQYGIDNIGSTHQLIDAFLNNGVILTEKTPTGKWAMNSDAFKIIEAINGSHPIVSAVAEYRKGMKYIGSYYDPVERYTRSDGRIHPYYRQMQARTLRMSANDPAIQTFPRDPEVRNMLVAADGCSYISADFSNMEARIFACLAPDEGMKQAFRDGVDLHCYTGGLMYNGGTPIEKNDPRRQLSKSSLFSTMFGGGVEVLAITAGIPHALAQETSRTLHKAFPSIKKHSRDMQEEAATMAAMDTINHRTGIRLADGRILRMDPGDDRLYAYQNYSIQGSARMVLAHSLISMDNAGIMEHGVAVIHDEIVVEVPDDIADDVAYAIAEYMPNDVMFDLPISVGVGKPSKRFGDADH